MPFFDKTFSERDKSTARVYGQLKKSYLLGRRNVWISGLTISVKGLSMLSPGQAKLSLPWEQLPGWNIYIKSHHQP